MGDYKNMSQWLLSVQVSRLLRLLATLHTYVDFIQQSSWYLLFVAKTDLDVIVLKTGLQYGKLIIILWPRYGNILDDIIITGNFNHNYHDNQNIAHPYIINYHLFAKIVYMNFNFNENKQTLCFVHVVFL